MPPHGTAADAPASRGGPVPLLLADRQGVAFVATARGVENLRVPRRYAAARGDVVAVAISDEEARSAELAPARDAGAWPRAVPRTDLLAPALSRLVSREHLELSLQPGRDGLKAALVVPGGGEQPFPIAPKDAVGFLAAVFQHAPRGVLQATNLKVRLLLGVRPAGGPEEYRLRLEAVLGAPPPAALDEAGLSPALLALLQERLERRASIVLVSGGPGSGRSTTLALCAAALAARRRIGARIGPADAPFARADLARLGPTLSAWPFPEMLAPSGVDYVVVDELEDANDLVLAARLAATGALVLAGTRAADAGALARAAARDLESASAPAVPVTVLAQSLVRTICRACAEPAPVPEADLRRYGLRGRHLEEIEERGGLTLASARGCAACSGTGAGGITGLYELADPSVGRGTLPRLREEGWRQVLQGRACLPDVVALPGAHDDLRTFREILVHAGAGAGAGSAEAHAEPRDASIRARQPAAARRTAAEAGATARPAAAQVRLLARLLKETRKGKSCGTEFADLARGIAARAEGDEPLDATLVTSGGFTLAAHGVNTALLSARIAAHLGRDLDRSAVAALGLAHDAGLLPAVDPETPLGVELFESAHEPSGAVAGLPKALAGLGAAGAGLESKIRQVHALLTFDPPAAEVRAAIAADVQVVALGALVDLHFHGPRSRPGTDLPDVTSMVMEQHGRRFAPVLFRALLKAIPIFPIGARVELSSGDEARVVSLNDTNHFRPRVEITSARDGRAAGERRVIDLARAPFLHIRRRLVAGAADEPAAPREARA